MGFLMKPREKALAKKAGWPAWKTALDVEEPPDSPAGQPRRDGPPIDPSTISATQRLLGIGGGAGIEGRRRTEHPALSRDVPMGLDEIRLMFAKEEQDDNAKIANALVRDLDDATHGGDFESLVEYGPAPVRPSPGPDAARHALAVTSKDLPGGGGDEPPVAAKPAAKPPSGVHDDLALLSIIQGMNDVSSAFTRQPRSDVTSGAAATLRQAQAKSEAAAKMAEQRDPASKTNTRAREAFRAMFPGVSVPDSALASDLKMVFDGKLSLAKLANTEALTKKVGADMARDATADELAQQEFLRKQGLDDDKRKSDKAAADAERLRNSILGKKTIADIETERASAAETARHNKAIEAARKKAPEPKGISPTSEAILKQHIADKKKAAVEKLDKVRTNQDQIANLLREVEAVAPGSTRGDASKLPNPWERGISRATAGNLGGDVARKVIQAVEQLMTKLGKEDSGLTLTVPEQDRLKRFLGMGLASPPEVMADALNIVRKGLHKGVLGRRGAFGKIGLESDVYSVHDEYMAANPDAIRETDPLFVGLEMPPPPGREAGGAGMVDVLDANGGVVRRLPASDPNVVKLRAKRPDLIREVSGG